jgi:hypothetical protein
MFIDVSAFSRPLTLVYELSEELKRDPRRVAKTQALTMNRERPLLGLKGVGGLFGSPEWWGSIASGKIETRTLAGTIAETYFAGQDARWGDEVNSFCLALPDGSMTSMDIPEFIPKHQKKRFAAGAWVCAVFAFDQLRRPANDGSPTFSKILLEMAISA